MQQQVLGKNIKEMRDVVTFQTSIDTDLIEEKINLLRIEMKDRRKNVEVILNPDDYLMHMKNIREQLRK